MGEKLFFDIRGGTIKYIQGKLETRTGCLNIRKYGSVTLPERLTRQGVLFPDEEVIRIVSNLVKKESLSARTAYVNISDPSIILRIVKVPFMSSKDLGSYLEMEISQYLPIDQNASIYDHKILSVVEEDGRKQMNVMLTAVPQELTRNYHEIFTRSGLRPVVMDVYPNSIARIFEKADMKNIAVMDVNGNQIDFIILKDKELFMYSNASIQNGFITDDTDESIDSLVERDEMFAAVMDEVTAYIRTYLNFFSSRHFGKNVDAVYILGDLAQCTGIENDMNARLQLDVRAGIPELFEIHGTKHSDYDSFSTDRNSINRRLALYAGNLGLILRGA